MSILAAIQALEEKAETTWEDIVSSIEGSQTGQKLVAWLKAQAAQIEAVGEAQVESIAEGVLTGIGTAIATGGNIGAAIASGLSTGEAATLAAASADAKNALYSAVSAGTAFLQAAQVTGTAPATTAAS